MARTRAQITSFVGYFTGRGTEKAALISLLCDEALQVAIGEHPFKDSRSYDQDFAVTEDATTVDISSLTGLRHVITARIVETSGDRNSELEMKNETWWAKNVINASDNQKGWPDAVLRRDSTIYLDRPAESGLTLRLVVSTDQTFSEDSTACPIAVADIFVTQYVTAMVFLSIEQQDQYARWYTQAMGSKYLLTGQVGGSLAHAIDLDKKDIAESYKMEPAGGSRKAAGAISVDNLISGHQDYGNTRLWSS